jgi:2-polyprenyl-6-methoxyphenol hydroxylase-like FAD-dependent oxidoreductase
MEPSPPRYSGYTCFRGVTTMPEGIQPGYLGEWWGRGRRFGITTLQAGRVYWWATVNVPQASPVAHSRDWLLKAFSEWAAPVPELIASTPESAFLQNDIIDRKPDRQWFKGRCLLVGDAAHSTTPNLGQGGCLAIEDAACLFHLFTKKCRGTKSIPRS